MFKKQSKEYYREGQIDPKAIKNLNYILEETGCKIVISSTWRKFDTLENLFNLLVKRGLDEKYRDNFIGMTPVLDSRTDSALWRAVERGHEIQAWLDQSLEIFKQIAIVDDDGDMAHLKPYLILTHGITGLNKEKTEEVILKLNSGKLL